MRPLLHLLALVAVLAFLPPVEGRRVESEREHGRAVVLDEGLGGLSEPKFRPFVFAAEAGQALESVSEATRSRHATLASAGPPASPPSSPSPACAPPRALAAAGPLPPGELPPAHAFLRVNGTANAHGARA